MQGGGGRAGNEVGEQRRGGGAGKGWGSRKRVGKQRTGGEAEDGWGSKGSREGVGENEGAMYVLYQEFDILAQVAILTIIHLSQTRY